MNLLQKVCHHVFFMKLKKVYNRKWHQEWLAGGK